MSDKKTPVSGIEWRELPAAERAVTPILCCKSCRAVKDAPDGTPTDLFPGNHCGDCPPWRCPRCGAQDSAAKHCGCWTDLTTMAPADIKAMFAADGTFNVESDGSLSLPGATVPGQEG